MKNNEVPKHYKERCVAGLDEAGNYYMRHIVCMAGEKLHMKSAIAAELGYRDMVIDQLETELAELKASIPQIQHDAIVKMQRASNAVVTTNCRCNSLNDHDEFAYKYAKILLTQAKEQVE